jgi:hypothetical protein
VGKLEGFYGSLEPAEQAMLGTILEGRNLAIRVGTSLGPGATGTRRRVARVRSRKPRGRMTWGWIVEQDEEDTQRFLLRVRW